MLNRSRAVSSFALAVVALTVTAPAVAQDLKIGYVNIEALLQQSPQYQEAARFVETEVARVQAELAAMEQQLGEEQQRFERDASVMSDEERAALERQIRDMTRDLQRAAEEGREELNILTNEQMAEIDRTLRQRIEAYARSEEYDLIIANAYYASADVDITDSILETLQ